MMTHANIPSAVPRLIAMQPGIILSRAAPAALTPRVQRYIDELGAPSVRRVGAAAFVRIDGALMSDPSWLADGVPCLTHAAVAATLDALAIDKSVATVVLDLECPGWGSLGSSDTLDAVARLRAGKRTVAWVHDAAYSGGVDIACACEEISATPTACFGHIGCLIFALDVTEMLAKDGVKAVAVCDPERKAEGYPGVPYSEDTLAELQRIVAHNAADFYGRVAKARGLTPEAVRGLGAAILAARDALDKRLIDRIESPEQFLTRVAALPARAATTAAGNAPAARKDRTMEYADITLAELKSKRPDLADAIAQEARAAAEADFAAKEKEPASFATLRAVFAGADDKAFVTDCLEKGLTLAAARDAHAATLAAKLKAAEERAAAAEQRSKDAEAKSSGGVPPLVGGGKNHGVNAGGTHPFLAAAEKLVADKKAADLGAAMLIMQRKDPAGHRDFIASGQRA